MALGDLGPNGEPGVALGKVGSYWGTGVALGESGLSGEPVWH